MTAPTNPPPEIPEHEYVRYVASGGFGDVFVYRDNIGRDVAIKVLHPSGLTPEAREAFQVEAARMARIRNRYVVTVYGFGIADDGRPYISMEYCPDSLAGVVARQRLAVADVLRHTVQVCSAVAAAHQEDMFHRDIKPANILLTHDGAPALTDFGIAGGRGAQPDEVRGLSLRYAAPEVIAGTSDGEERADTYSLAATAYKLLSGRAPFEQHGGDNAEAALVERTLAGRLTPTGRVDVPPSLERVLARGLAPDPDARFASPTSLARALQEVELELGFSATPASFDDVGVAARDVRTDVEDDDGTRYAAPQRVDPTGAPRVTLDATGEPAPTATGLARAAPAVSRPSATRTTSPGRTPTDATELRTGRVRPAPTDDDPVPAPASAPPAANRRRSLVLAGSAVVVVSLVVVLILASQAGTEEGPGDEVTDPAPLAEPATDGLFTQPTVPTGVEVAREDGGVRVTWDADPVPEVTYVVTTTAGPDEGGSITTSEPTVVVDDGDGDEQVCVRVLAVLGSTSTEPSREVCTR